MYINPLISFQMPYRETNQKGFCDVTFPVISFSKFFKHVFFVPLQIIYDFSVY